MKRHLTPILIFLLLGAILNVAVAWGCVLIAPASTDLNEQSLTTETMPIRIRELHNSLLPPDIVDADPLYTLRSYIGFCHYSIVSGVIKFDVEKDSAKVDLNRADTIITFTRELGWPFQSLWDYYFFENRDGTHYSAPSYIKREFGHYSINYSLLGFRGILNFPYYVRWWASLGNTLFYAALLWILFRSLLIIRRKRMLWNILIYLTLGALLNSVTVCVITIYRINKFITSSLQGGAGDDIDFVGTPFECVYFNYGYGVSYVPPNFQFYSWTYSIDFIGFGINTIYYAVLLWLLILVPFILRRKRRIRRGLCVKCGYIISVNAGEPNASPNCTECGTPLPKKRIKTSPA